MTTNTTLSYPFDPTGSLASNLITGEQQQLVAQNFRDQHIIVPAAAPYFADTLVLTFKDTSGAITTLIEGQDYYCTHEFISASRACAMRVFGSISFINTALAGIVSQEYQTVGGTWTLLAAQIATILANTIDNPRTTSWEEVSGTPYAFPPEAHSWNITDLVGMSSVVAGLNSIASTLQETGGTGLAAHIADHTNPHVTTAAQVGLGLVQNYAIAANSDAVLGTSTSLYMTPSNTAAAIQSQVLGQLEAHEVNYLNPHQTTAAQLGLGLVQNFGVAAAQDAANGSSNILYMTPALTTIAINATVGQTLQAHILNYDNPHEVTAAQIGLSLVRNLTTASTPDAIAGLSDSFYMTPASTAAAISATGSLSIINSHIANYNNPHNTTAAQVGAYSESQVNTLLLGYLTTTGVAADSAKLGGQTPAELTASILAGTVTNATTVGGLTPAQLLAFATSGTAVNAAEFGGMTPADWDAYIANATVANAILAYGLTFDTLKSDILTGTAANAATLNGESAAQLTEAIQAGTVANATTLSGLSVAQLTTQIQGGTVANATTVQNKSVSQLTAAAVTATNAQLWTAGTVPAQEQIPASTDTADATLWTSLGKLPMPGSAQIVTHFPDVQWLVAGGDASSDTESGAWLLRVSVRDTTQPNNVALQAISLTGINTTTAVFGYTIDELTTPNAPVLTVWMKTPGGTNPISVTSLSENTTQFLSSVTTAIAEPANITYTIADTYALASEVSNMLTQLTTAFTALSAAVSGSAS